MVDVHTVGAGGGSIGWRDAGGALRVGPQSAGADPGPACYGRGGTEPTVTDANLLLGYLDASSTLAGGVDLDVEAARRRSRRLGSQLGLETLETAEGIVRVANQEMIRALRVVTVDRGIDPRDFALMPFGGAGPDACRGARGRARHEPASVPACQRRPLRARPDRLGAPSRHGAHRDARGRRPDGRAGRRRGRRAPGIDRPRGSRTRPSR